MKSFDPRPKRCVKLLVIAMSLALPGSAVLAATIDDVVKTRADQNIDQQYGRDSVYAFSPDAKPLKPEQSGARDTNVLGKVKGYAAEAWHKTEGFAAGLWDKTTGLFRGHEGAASSVAQTEPEGYGRAGGFIGADRVAVLESPAPNQANATPTSYQPTHIGSEVKTGTAAASPADGLGGPPETSHSEDSTQTR